MRSAYLGFLTEPLSGGFDGGRLTPVEDYELLAARVVRDSNKDGFYYPPQVAEYSVDPTSGSLKEKVIRSQRPASLFVLPSSHTVTLDNPIEAEAGSTPLADEALITYALAMLYGTRLQLSKWSFDGRVPIKPLNNIYLADHVALHFVGHIYKWWRSLSAEPRMRAINILYVMTRAASLEWDWDAFLHQYMALDAIHKLHALLNGVSSSPAPRHRDRINDLIAAYGAARHDTLVDAIYRARNDLFHEAIWTGTTIGYGLGNDEFQYPRHLARLNARLICGLSGYANEYSRTTWSSLGTFEFDMYQGPR